jgi:hyperosmotically inducible periplasmic protein
MKRRLLLVALSLFALTTMGLAQEQPSARAQERITKEVRHELLMLPWFGVFDYIAYKVDGYNVILLGQVSRTLKSDAENAVKHIEGVEKVDNQIEVLPTSPMDEELRLKLYRAIYGYPPLEKYALGVQKPIRIIVKNGRVTLEGVIDSEADKNLVTIRANSVPGNEGFPSVQRPLCLTSLPGVEKSRLLPIQLVIKPDFVQGGLLTVCP